MPAHDQTNGPIAPSPLKISQGEFLRSNVFISWSPKLEREVRLLGPSFFDAWLTIEFTPDIVEFCERPPSALQLSPNEGAMRNFDFWLRNKSGSQAYAILYDPELGRNSQVSLELLERAVRLSGTTCHVWHASDLRRRLTYLRNLKQLLPFVSSASKVEGWMLDRMKDYLSRHGQASWLDLVSTVPTQPLHTLHSAIAWLIHRGTVVADLDEFPLSNSTVLRQP
jgi:hypothetical protein